MNEVKWVVTADVTALECDLCEDEEGFIPSVVQISSWRFREDGPRCLCQKHYDEMLVKENKSQKGINNGDINEYDLAQKVDNLMLEVMGNGDLTDMQLLNYLRTIERSATLAHTTLVDKLLLKSKP